MKNLRILLIICAVLLFNGCVTMNGMTLDWRKDVSFSDGKSIALLTIKTSNTVSPEHVPIIDQLNVYSIPENQRTVFVPTLPIRNGGGEFNEYLVSIDLSPGTYKFYCISGHSQGTFTRGTFYWYPGILFQLNHGEVLYIGHLDLTNREKKEGETASGMIVPLIDQAASGFASGTLETIIEDRSDYDIKLFTERYPLLNSATILTRLMELKRKE